MGRDHSIECEQCGLQRGGINELLCECDEEEVRLWLSGQHPGAAPAERQAVMRLVDALSAVMSTLSRSACSPEEQRIYDRARALLAERGVGGVPEEMREAQREWESKR